MYNEVKELLEEIEYLQSVIDSLMLEYCPDEMTQEQLENWGKHQRAVDLKFEEME